MTDIQARAMPYRAEVVDDARPVDEPAAKAKSGLRAALAVPGSAPRRAAITTIDQCFSSASNFAVGVVVARVAGPAGLGAYSIAYAVWLVLAVVHRAMVTDPMAIDGDARRDDAHTRLQSGATAEITFGVVVAIGMAACAAGIMVVGQHNVGLALLVLAPFVPFLLIQDYWRWVGFMQARPTQSLLNDAVFNCIMAALLVALIVCGLRSPSIAILAWGVGAAVAAIYGARQFRVVPQRQGGVAMMRSRWHMSKWLLASGVTGWGSNQAWPIFAAPGVGSAGLGGVRAAQSLVAGPSLVLLQAGGSMGLPEASHGLEHHGWAGLKRVARWVTVLGIVSVGAVAALVFVAGPTILSKVYGPEFAKYALTAQIIGVAWLVQTVSLGSVIVLKATRRTRQLSNIGFAAFFVSAVTLVTFSYVWGVQGTAWAMVVNSAFMATALLRAERTAAREFAAEVHPSAARWAP
jgi:PST family polysaccharide transporter